MDVVRLSTSRFETAGIETAQAGVIDGFDGGIDLNRPGSAIVSEGGAQKCRRQTPSPHHRVQIDRNFGGVLGGGAIEPADPELVPVMHTDQQRAGGVGQSGLQPGMMIRWRHVGLIDEHRPAQGVVAPIQDIAGIGRGRRSNKHAV